MTPDMNGWILIEYGLTILQNGEMQRVWGLFSHIIPKVKVGDKVEAEIEIACFASTERFGYWPELEIKIFVEDEEGSLQHIDPVLVGLLPE